MVLLNVLLYKDFSYTAMPRCCLLCLLTYFDSFVGRAKTFKLGRMCRLRPILKIFLG